MLIMLVDVALAIVRNRKMWVLMWVWRGGMALGGFFVGGWCFVLVHGDVSLHAIPLGLTGRIGVQKGKRVFIGFMMFQDMYYD